MFQPIFFRSISTFPTSSMYIRKSGIVVKKIQWIFIEIVQYL